MEEERGASTRIERKFAVAGANIVIHYCRGLDAAEGKKGLKASLSLKSREIVLTYQNLSRVH
jgi:hypothetical protein